MAESMYTPYGFRDYVFEDAQQRIALHQKLHSIFTRYGYRDVETPIVEYLQVFDKERGSISPLDMYKFVDRDGELLSLRPDMTPALARMAAFYFKKSDLPLRVTSTGSTFRYNSRYSAKQRQLSQTGIELYGNGTIYEDAEVLAVAVMALKESGIQDYRITVGHAGLIQGLLEALSVEQEERREWISQIESKNRIALEQKALNKGLSKEEWELLSLMTEAGDRELLLRGQELSESLGWQTMGSYFERLAALDSRLEQYEVKQYVIYDPGMHPELGYYTGVIFQGYALGSGEPVLDGGRYDALLRQFYTDWAAIGFGIYQDRLMMALKQQQKVLPMTDYVLVAGAEAEEESMVSMATKLRSSGIPVMLMVGMENPEIVQDYGRSHQCLYYMIVDGDSFNGGKLDGSIEVRGLLEQALSWIREEFT